MKKLLTSLLASLGISATSQAEQTATVSVTPFEKAVLEAKATNELTAIWELFVNTHFYIITIPLDSGNTTSDFRFSIFQNPKTQNEPMVIISEHLERLENNSSSNKAIKITGAKLVQLLNPEAGIVIAIPDGGFGLTKERVQWLRESIQQVH